MRHKIFVVRARRGLGHPETARLVRTAAAAALDAEGIGEPCEIGVTLTDGEGIHAINLEQRGVDAPTDVLSFPIDEYDYDAGCRYLGDMVLNLERVESQSVEYGGGYAHEAQYLTVHSVLHLLGYDHLDEGEEKARMRAREKAVMEGLGYDF
ncbi:MAG: rRNA maturation RNase YbeY [Oscillospiraceae bacterium]|nr:rRNA maturation RNase YbeY [Oscillospiraceae bacterium]